MKKIAAFLALTCLLVASAQAAPAKSPTQTLKEGLDKLITIVHDPVYDLEDTLPEEQVARLSEAVSHFFDYQELTKRSVGRVWLSFTEQQQRDMVAAFRDLLEKTYLKKLETKFLDELKVFNEESVIYHDEKIRGDKSMVFTTFSLSDSTLDVNFRLIEKNGAWMVYDIIGEGVTLLGVYQDDFQAALAKMTPEEFIEELKRKTRDVVEGKVDPTFLDKAEKESDKPAGANGN